MERYQDMEKYAVGLGIKMAIIKVKKGESNQEAWIRHLTENPGDASATVKVFNHLKLQRTAGGFPLKR
jgi:hypothetical protein